MNSYPTDRTGVWATDYEKVMLAAQVARTHGPAAYLLLRVVAMTEHRINYLQPPDFWNGQIMTECALRDEDSFVALRTRLVRAGWLMYKRGDRQGAMGQYWVTIPAEIAQRLDRIPGASRIPRSDRGTNPGTYQGRTRGTSQGANPGTTPPSSRGTTPGTTPDLPHPSPNPLPSPHPHPHAGGAGDVGDVWQSIKDRRSRIEAILDSLQVATGPKATGRWMEALKTCKRVRTMADAEACLRESIERGRAAGETVNYASDVADRIRRWKPTEAQS